MMRRVFLSLSALFGFLPLFAETVVVSHGSGGSANPLYRFNALPTFDRIDSSDAFGLLGNHVRFYNGRFYTVDSYTDTVYVHDLNLTLVDAIPTTPGSNLYMGEYAGGKVFVSRLLHDSITAYDLTTHAKVWSVGVNPAPQYVGLFGDVLIALSTGYDFSNYQAGPSTIYAIDTLNGNILHSLDLDTNMLYVLPWRGDTLLVSGGRYGTAEKIYVLTYSTGSGFSKVDSLTPPATFGFMTKVAGDTVLMIAYDAVYYYFHSTGTFQQLNLGTFNSFSPSAVVFGERLFLLYSPWGNPGNLVVFNRTSNSIEDVKNLSTSPTSITLAPDPIGISEITRIPPRSGENVYDVSGRRVKEAKRRGVYFVREGDRVKKVLNF